MLLGSVRVYQTGGGSYLIEDTAGGVGRCLDPGYLQQSYCSSSNTRFTRLSPGTRWVAQPA
jgi:hypothetical protein